MAKKASSKKRIGSYQCWSCSKVTPVFETESGALSATCGWCEMRHYAMPHTEHHRNLAAKVTREAPEPAAAPTEKKPERAHEPEKKEAPKKSSGPFWLGGGK